MRAAARRVITPVGRALLLSLAVVVACGSPAAVATGPDPASARSARPHEEPVTPPAPLRAAPREAPIPTALEVPTSAEPEAPTVAPTEPPPEAPDPSVGVAPPAVHWSGLRVLYLVHPGWEAHDDEPAMPPHATPVACTDGRSWLRDGCGRLAAGATVRFADGSTARLGRALPDSEWGHWRRALSRVPEDARFAVHASRGAPRDLRPVRCALDEDATLAPLAGPPLAEGGPSCAPIRAGLDAGAFVVAESLRIDLDGDGSSDRLVRLESRDGPLRDVSITALERGGASVLFELTDRRYLPTSEPCREDPGPLFLDQSECFDLDADGRVELWGTYRGDSEREYELVELGEDGERVVGGGIGFGD